MRPVRIDEVRSRPLALPPVAGATPADAVDGIGSGPSVPDHADKQRRLAQLTAFRDRGIISDQAFRGQRRMQGGSPAPLPGPSGPATPLLSPPRRRRRWMLLGLACLNLAGFGLFGLNALKPSSRAAPVSGAAADPAVKVHPDAENVYLLNELFQAGPYSYTITGFETTTALGNQFSPMHAGEGNEYLVVTFSVRNDSTRPRVVSTDAFVLEDANGAVYRTCSQGAASPRSPLTRGDVWLPEIQPGSTKALAAAFEVPQNSLQPPVKLLILEQGPSGSREATVYLRRTAL